ncbi:hypothetical protein ACOSQ3_027850 [Xanthoceras sorbifolium]
MFGLNLVTSYPPLSLSKNRLTSHWSFLVLGFCIFWIEDHKVKYHLNWCVFGCEWKKKEAERFGEGKITRIRKKISIQTQRAREEGGVENGNFQKKGKDTRRRRSSRGRDFVGRFEKGSMFWRERERERERERLIQLLLR